MIGYKAIQSRGPDGQPHWTIAKLEIPECAIVIGPYEGKFRADEAIVLEIRGITNGKNYADGTSLYSYLHRGIEPQKGARKFSYSDRLVYTVGQRVVPNYFNTSRVACSNGIHFYTVFDLCKRFITSERVSKNFKNMMPF